MRRRKKRVKILPIILAVIISVVALRFTITYFISENNYTYNLLVEESFSGFNSGGYISDVEDLEPFKYSLTNGAVAGEAIIATYNTLNYLKEEEGYVEEFCVSDIIKAYDFYGAMAFGRWGTNPLAVKWYLESLGLTVGVNFDRDSFFASLEASTCVIYYSNNFESEDFSLITYYDSYKVTFYGPPIRTVYTQYTLDYQDSMVMLITIDF